MYREYKPEAVMPPVSGKGGFLGAIGETMVNVISAGPNQIKNKLTRAWRNREGRGSIQNLF